MRPVFVTARFRTGSTMLWEALSAVPGARAFYEPLNEWLPQLLAAPASRNTRSVAAVPTFAAYSDVDRVEALFDPGFGVTRLLLEADDEHPALERWLRHLIDCCGDDVPILACNRLDFRLPWIRRRFPDARIVHLYRSPRDQWVSTLVDRPKLSRDPLEDDPFRITTWARDLAASFPFLASPAIGDLYERFYYVWKLSYLAGTNEADVSVAYEDLVRAPTETLSRLLAGVGLHVDDVRVPAARIRRRELPTRRSRPDELDLDAFERTCEATLEELGLTERFGRVPFREIARSNTALRSRLHDPNIRRWAVESAQRECARAEGDAIDKQRVIDEIRRAHGAATIATAGTPDRGSSGGTTIGSRLGAWGGLGIAMAHLVAASVIRVGAERTRPPGSRTWRYLRRWSVPRLGQLKQHAPIPLRPPPPCPSPLAATAELPVISIITPVKDGATHLRECAASILDQSYPRLEYVIQHGGSRDGTNLILEELAPRLHRCNSTADRGQAHALNLGFADTTGEIMAWLNADDLLLPGSLGFVGELFARRPDIDVIYGHRILVDAAGDEVGRWILPPHDARALEWADFVPQETMFWRRSIWNATPERGLDESYDFALDWDLLLRFARAGARILRVPRFLGAFRVHENQKTSRELDGRAQSEMARIRRATFGRDVTPHEAGRRVRRYLARSLVHDALYRAGLTRL